MLARDKGGVLLDVGYFCKLYQHRRSVNGIGQLLQSG